MKDLGGDFGARNKIRHFETKDVGFNISRLRVAVQRPGARYVGRPTFLRDVRPNVLDVGDLGSNVSGLQIRGLRYIGRPPLQNYACGSKVLQLRM